MANNISDLRTHLFETINALKDKNKPMDIERARAISDIAQVIINSAKVEVEHVKVSGQRGSGFIPEAPEVLPAGTTRVGPGHLVHRISG